MAVIFVKDSLRASVEAATGGKVTVLYDDKGYPSYMVRIPKFNIEDIDPGLGSGVHPAFIVGGIEKPEIFIGQFQAKVLDDRACSLPGVDPSTSMTYDQALTYCNSKGSGWHLMTMWEWAAVALWCMKNGFQPRGNTYYGRSHEAAYETGTRIDNGNPGSTSGTPRILSGSGPASWRHNNTFAGIADLVGNIWEWQYGLKIVDGRIIFTQDNNFYLSENSWYQSNVYINSSASGTSSSSGDIGDPSIADSVTNYAGPQGDDNPYAYIYLSTWRSMQVTASASSNLTLLKQMLVAPSLTGTGQLLETIKGGVWVRNYGERMPSRGGNWDDSSNAGLGALDLNSRRSNSHWSLGCRPAFIA